jgi:hypothetical protein
MSPAAGEPRFGIPVAFLRAVAAVKVRNEGPVGGRLVKVGLLSRQLRRRRFAMQYPVDRKQVMGIRPLKVLEVVDPLTRPVSPLA